MKEDPQQNQNQTQPVEGNDGQQSQDNKNEQAKVTFTDEQQAAIDKMLSEKLAKERSKAEEAQQAAVKKAEERAKMTAEERAEAERKDREKAMEQERQDLAKQKREYATKSLLLDKGISADMLPLVMGADDDATRERLNLLERYTQSRIEEATQKLLKGKSNPTAGNGGAPASTAGNPWAKGSFNLTKHH